MSNEQPVCVVKTKSRFIAGAASLLLAVGAAVATNYLLNWLQRPQLELEPHFDLNQSEITKLANSWL